MAKKSRSRNPMGGPPHTHFKPGNNANPRGAGAHDPEMRALKKLTREDLKGTLEMLMAYSMDELEALAREPSTTVVKACAASAILRARNSGDWSFLEGPLVRAIGAVKQEVEHTGKDGGPLIPATPELRHAELQAIMATLASLTNAKAK